MFGAMAIGGLKMKTHKAAVARLFQRNPGITAVFAHTDVMAIGALRALQALGQAVPKQCSVVGCDDIDSAAYTNPPLTTVHMPFFETGSEAMRLLLGMIKIGSLEPRRVLLPVRLIERSSTAIAAAD